MWRKNSVLALIISLTFVFFAHGDFGRYFMQDEGKNLKLEERVEHDGIDKSVKTKKGDFVDCVDIYKQPAFKNPLLRNHTLQLKPTTIPKELNNAVLFDGAKTTIFRSAYMTCPQGTIPIRIIEKKSFEDSTGNTQNNTLLYRFALLKMIHFPDDVFYGASTEMKLDNPHCEIGQSSGGSIWIASDLSDQKNVIKAGWMVHPEVYGDAHTRFSIYWTSDGFHKTGCYDILCPGFVQVDNDFTLGVTLVTNNFHKSRNWHTMYFYIFQDISTQHWWLVTHNIVESKIIYIGYWPKELFSRFGQGAAILHFGGSVMARVGQQFPPMGDGYFPDGQKTNSNYFENIRYVNKSNYLVPPRSFGTKLHSDNPNCYGLIYEETDEDDGDDHFLFMGGPGGQC